MNTDALFKALNEHNEARWKREADEALLDSPRLPPAMAASEKISQWHKDYEHEDRWVPLTPEELEALAEETVEHLNSYQEKLMDEEPSVGRLEPITKEYFTCYRCSAASKCPYTFDPYNTAGDCLASK